IPFAAALQGALHYPYGCAEQTASRGYAALMLDEATVAMLGIDDVDAGLRQRTVEAAFGRLASMQASNGHFSMWGSSGPTSPMLTPYIAEFLLDAREAGFAVPEAVLQSALERLNEDLLAGGQEFYGRDHRQYLKLAYQAHAGFVLARVNRAPLGTLRALFDNHTDAALSGLPLVRLGLALRMQGDTARGEKAIGQGFAWRGERPRWLGDYSTPLRDAALAIALVHEQDAAKPEYTARAIDVGRELDARRSQRWTYLSTQEQIAIARLGKALAADGDRRVSGVLWTGDSDEPVSGARIFGRQFDHAELAAGVRFEPAGEPPLYASLEVAGVPRSAPEADFTHLKVERSLYRLDGTPWEPGPLAEGEALIVAVSITADQAMPDALLTDLLPAGLEIENFNLSDTEQWGEVTVQGVNLSDRAGAADVRHEEFRDDRYVAALNLRRGSTARLFYLVRAVTPGTYTVPPPMVEDMYRPELRGVGRAVPESITVVQP
ncbi:MAG: alpha-2-macroglobulin family protein, partial [Luteimonas sp.]